MNHASIPDQVRLGRRVALDVVMQGVRIRLGRSMITLMGVVLGIAFLMSMLCSQLIREGVAHEEAARTEVRRMHSFLTAEMGAVRDCTIGVVQVGPLSDAEQRFVRELIAEHVAGINWWAADGCGCAPQDAAIRVTTPAELSVGAGAVIVMGEGDVAGPARDALSGLNGKGVLACTRAAHARGLGVQASSLARELKEDETARQAEERRRSRFRAAWIIVISLLVTTIGIGNAMLMSVTERFREIGTMKCLGALSRFIQAIFFLESSLMGLVGSVAGSLAGFLFSFVAYSLTYGPGLVLDSLSVGRLLLYALLSVAAGVGLSVVAAVYPARFASRMVPAHALRSTV